MVGLPESNTIRAAFWRGGTSNALMIHKSDLPSRQSDWEPILAGAIGSPDYYGRQLNGMGGGVSSLSKVCVIAPSARPDADVEYTFIQMGIRNGKMDLAGTCGNMTSAVGPFAIDENIVKPRIDDEDNERKATVRIYNTNTDKFIHAKFTLDKGTSRFKSSGDYAIDGVPGTASCITLSFLHPGGSKTGHTLPTGNAIDTMDLSKLETFIANQPQTLSVSLVDAANPAVIIRAEDIGVRSDITPDELDADGTTLDLLEQIRQEGARMMGMDDTVESIPKMVMVSSALQDLSTANGVSRVNLVARVLSMRQPHRAIPLTIALNLGVASQIANTLPHSLLKGPVDDGRVVVGHPSGQIEVGALMRNGSVEGAILQRTARPLMRGEVYWR